MKPQHTQALSAIRYYLLKKGKSPSIRAIQEKLKYKSPRSVSLLLEDLMEEGRLQRKENGDLQILQNPESESAHTKEIPVVGQVACGMPMLAQENIEAYIPVALGLLNPFSEYFFLRAIGDSMNRKGINDGDLVLIKQQEYADKGDSIVALINDEATIKEYCPSDNAIVLKPHSTNSEHQVIILDEEFRVQGVVVQTFQDVL